MGETIPVLSAALMLGGGLRPSSLGYAIGGSPLDLEIRPGMTVAMRWIDLWRTLPNELLRPRTVRCLVARGAPLPKSISGALNDSATIEVDAREYCGPAGAVRDAVMTMSENEIIIVHEAATFPATPMQPLLEDHFASGAQATVGMNPDGSPAGIYLFRAGQFHDVSRVGFTDLKEQFLDRLRTRGCGIRVHRFEGLGVLPLRSRADFLHAARVAGNRRVRASEDVAPAFVGPGSTGAVDSAISDSARVAPGARVIGSVIMSGSSVDEGAIVARSIVCPDAVVGPDQHVVDSVVAKDGVRTDGWASARARWRQKS